MAGKIWEQKHPQQDYPPDEVLAGFGYETRKQAERRRETKAVTKAKHSKVQRRHPMYRHIEEDDNLE